MATRSEVVNYSEWCNGELSKLSENCPLHGRIIGGTSSIVLGDSDRSEGYGIFPVRQRNVLRSQEWVDYRQHFVSSLKAVGHSVRFSYALSKTLTELSDNIIQHSEPDGIDDFKGVVGYHVDSDEFTLCVSDAGRGILSSLRDNQANADLNTDTEAVMAAAKDHRSRRPDNCGTGFKQLFRSLADLNCRISFASGNARVVFEGIGEQSLTTNVSANEVGFHLEVFWKNPKIA
ncbi:hypothetical protein DDZ13_09670 [Coraliomargarita sinensis]|uniref:Uncharacterized protein n=2 Tax=Coraliomargarita sinensis TaxID=2174842 RepID=A0A317ZJ16_9BACT|nr:hypothetical protein DDZ13_09670 [Coraliomargarita sinensis]